MTRINWLLRQLGDAPEDLRVDVHFAKRRESSSALLRDCRKDPSILLLAADSRCQPRAFGLALTKSIRAKSGSGDGSFVAEVRSQAVDFYRDIVQDLKPPPPSTPKLPDAKEPDPPPLAPAQPAAAEGQVRREQAQGLQNLVDLFRTTTS